MNTINARLFATGSSQYSKSINTNNQARLIATAGGYPESKDQLPAIKVKSKTQGIKKRTTNQKQQNLRRQ